MESQNVVIQPLPQSALRFGELAGPDQDGQCGIVLDPLCHGEASAILFESCEQSLPVPLFATTPLAGSLSASPWLAALASSSPFPAWLESVSPAGWGLYFYSPHKWEQVVSHVRSLVLAWEGGVDNGRKLIFRFWDNRVLMRIAQNLPQSMARLMGPLQTLITQDETGNWFKIVNPKPTLSPADSPVPWYVFDDAHIALFDDRADEVTAFNVAERIYSYMEEEDIPLPPEERLNHFALRQMQRVKPIDLTNEDDLVSFVLCALYMGENQAYELAAASDGGRADRLRTLWRQCAAEKSREEA